MIIEIFTVAGAFAGGTGLFGLVKSRAISDALDRLLLRVEEPDQWARDLDSLSFYTEGTDGQDFRPATVCPHCSAFTYHLFGAESTSREAIGIPEFHDGRRFDSKQITRSMVRYCLACGKEWSEVMSSGIEKDSIALEVSDERLAKLTQDLFELDEYWEHQGRHAPSSIGGAGALAARFREISDQVNACHDEQREIRRLLTLKRFASPSGCTISRLPKVKIDISEEVEPLDQVTSWWRDGSDQLSG